MKNRLFPLLLLLITMLLTTGLWSQANPFLSTGDETSPEQEIREAPKKAPSPSGPLLQRTIAMQRQLQRTISDGLGEIASGERPGALWGVLFFSFLYGFFHALGPGHRKTVLVGYFIGEEAKPAMGILAGVALAAVHAGSAILLVGGIGWIAKQSVMLTVNQAQVVLLPISYGVIALLGLYMLIHGIHDFRHHHHHHDDAKGIGGIIISGLVPCPGAAAIMIFALVSNAFLIGSIAVLAMSLGMGILLAGIGLVSILFRRSISRFLADEERGRFVELALHVVGGLLVAGFGLLLLVGSLSG